MRTLSSSITTVLQEMRACDIGQALCGAFLTCQHYFNIIESGFITLTSRRQHTDVLRYFFQSWSQTNNSAMTVAGIGNRMTLLVHRQRNVANETALLRALSSLSRIVDEDLAVTQKVLHSELFYKMATTIVGDDAWLSRRYLLPAAQDFKSWKDYNSLRAPDLFVALLTTLTHEIYTHGEVELILPLFTRWLREDFGFSEQESRRALGWISVHCGPTERNHFFHAIDAIDQFSRATDLPVGIHRIDGIVGTYLEKKAAVLQQINQQTMADSRVGD